MAKKKSVSDAIIQKESAAITEVAADTPENNTSDDKTITKKKGDENMRDDNIELLKSDDEIAVSSIIPNVTYKDKRNGDYYEWNKAGHTEYMSVAAIGDMWRSNKGYFKNLWLYPQDPRIIKKFKLEKTYSDYEFLISSPSYISDNLPEIRMAIGKASNQLKLTILNKIKLFIADGDLTDIKVIRELEKLFDTELI